MKYKARWLIAQASNARHRSGKAGTGNRIAQPRRGETANEDFWSAVGNHSSVCCHVANARCRFAHSIDCNVGQETSKTHSVQLHKWVVMHASNYVLTGSD